MKENGNRTKLRKEGFFSYLAVVGIKVDRIVFREGHGKEKEISDDN